MEKAEEYSENIAYEGASASDCDSKNFVTLTKSLKKSKSSKKKRLSKSPEMPDIQESFKKRRYPLRNLQAYVIPKSDEPSVILKSDKPSGKTKSGEQPKKSKSGKPPVKQKSREPSIKSNSKKPPVKLKSGEPALKSTVEEQTVKSKPDKPTVMSKYKSDKPRMKSKSDKPPVKSEELPMKLRSGKQFLTPYESKLSVTEKLSSDFKKDLKSEFEDLTSVVTIEQFVFNRRIFLFGLLSYFMDAYLFNAAVDVCLCIKNVFSKRTDTAGNKLDWKLFHIYWDKFKEDFNIMGMKFINCYPMSAISIRKLQKCMRIEPNNIWMKNKLRNKDKVHFPRTKDEFDIFLRSIVDIYDIVTNILSVCHCHFDGFLRYCIETDENLFHRYISQMHDYLSPLNKKLRNEIKEFKLFEEKVLNKQ